MRLDGTPANQCGLLGLGDVERAFVHVDYEDAHDINEEHKPLFEKQGKKEKRTLKEILLRTKKATAETPTEPVQVNTGSS